MGQVALENAAILSSIRELVQRPGPAASTGVTPAELAKALSLRSEYLARRLLVALGATSEGVLAREKLVSRVQRLSEAPLGVRLQFAFHVHDDDGDGYLSRAELERMVWLSLEENQLRFADIEVDALIDALFARADGNRDGVLSFDEFYAALGTFPAILEHLSVGDLRGLGFAPVASPRAAKGRAISAALARNARAWALLVSLWAVAHVALFAYAVLRYRAMGAAPLVWVARGFGAGLNLDAALVLLPMLRWLITVIGRSALGRVLADDHVGFHRLVGWSLVWGGILHTLAHLANAALGPRSVAALLTSTAGATGLGLVAVLGLMGYFARDAVRRSKHFERFRQLHGLYPLFFLLVVAHGPVTWWWVAAPMAAFAVERVILRNPVPVRVLALDPLPGGVTRVTLARPPRFRFDAGDYLFLRVALLGQFEWHPFTISSAPEDAARLTLHVRAVGNWTERLGALASSSHPGLDALEAHVEGPYGTPSAHIFRARRCLFVAAGIGVTPFASVLASLLARWQSGAPCAVERVSFVWLCRGQREFRWFTEMLGQLEARFGDRFEARIFMTGARPDLKSTMLLAALEVLYADTARDLVTGLRARTHFGQPPWDALLSELAAREGSGLEVFYCGPHALGAVLEAACDRVKIGFRQEHF